MFGFSQNALDSVNDSEVFVYLVPNGLFGLVLSHILVDDLDREVEVIDDVLLNNDVEGHFLIQFDQLIIDPIVEHPDGLALKIFAPDLSDGDVGVLHLNPFYFFLRSVESDDEVHPLRD